MTRKKILIVEDESIIALNLQAILQNKGYEIIGIAASGKDALRSVFTSNPDLVIADIILKGPMDGIAFVEKLKNELNIPVIYITAYSDGNTLNRAKKTKPSGYIIKPINTEQLLTTIEIAFYKHEMEKKLSESENRYRSLAEAAQDAIFIIDKNDNIQYVNSYTARQLGYEPEDLTGKKRSSFFPSDISDKQNEFIREVFQSGNTINDTGMISYGQKKIWLSTTLVPLKNNNGEVTSVLGISRDISNIKLIEEKLLHKNEELEAANEELLASLEEQESTNEELIETQRELIESEKKYKALFNNANDAIFIHDLQGNMLEVNDIACARLGYSRDELMRMSPKDFDSPEFSSQVENRIEELLKNGSLIFESEHVKKDGTTIPVEISSKIIDFNHKPAVLSLARDRTERKKAEKKLKTSYANLRALIENMSDYALICDGKGRPVMYNSAYSKIMKKAFNADVEPGLRPSKFLNDKKLIKMWESHIKRVLKGEQFTVEYSHRFEDDDVRFFEISFTPILEEGKVSGFTEIARDITERKKTQEIIIQTEKMITVGSLAAGIAHEINNPLGVIMQGIQLLQKRLSLDTKSNRNTAKKSGLDPDKTALFLREQKIFGYLDGMYTAGKRAADIVANMLQFTRKSKSRLRPENINPIIDKSIEIASKDYDFKKNYDFRRIEIIKDFAENLPEIKCSASDMQQVFLNIFKNSAQAMSEVRDNKFQPVLSIKTVQEKEHVKIEISDNGPGIDSKTLKHIFEPFYTTKGIGSGTGLGLSISYYIITNNHKGSISAESEPGKGTKFLIKLPL